MNIVVIISDTMRWDHLGCYGNEWIHTPHLDQLAERSVVFNKAYCTSFPTMPMRADLYTGKFTFTYLGWAPMPLDEVILPQLMSGAGYRTMAVVDTPFYIRRGYAYDRGFRDFRWIRGQGADRADTNYERRYEEDYCAPMTCMAAERWIERHYKENFFLYVDTWDPHEPWDPPAHYVELYKPDWDGALVGPPYWHYEERGITQERVDIARACYAGEVTMVDRAVGRLVDRIESMGLMGKTAIIFTADHGFLIGEHGMFGKALMQQGHFYGAPLYEEIAKVPLTVYIPGVEPRRSDALISHPDVMPTILEMAGVEIPDAVQGKSFLSVAKGEVESHREFVVSTMPLYNPGEGTRVVDNFDRRVEEFLPATITTDKWSLLYTREGAPVELYDLDSDPVQAQNVAADNMDVVKELHRQYVSLLEELGTEERLLAPRREL
jgi:arylsulfatase A-like enzyme